MSPNGDKRADICQPRCYPIFLNLLKYVEIPLLARLLLLQGPTQLLSFPLARPSPLQAGLLF